MRRALLLFLIATPLLAAELTHRNTILSVAPLSGRLLAMKTIERRNVRACVGPLVTNQVPRKRFATR